MNSALEMFFKFFAMKSALEIFSNLSKKINIQTTDRSVQNFWGLGCSLFHRFQLGLSLTVHLSLFLQRKKSQAHEIPNWTQLDPVTRQKKRDVLRLYSLISLYGCKSGSNACGYGSAAIGAAAAARDSSRRPGYGTDAYNFSGRKPFCISSYTILCFNTNQIIFFVSIFIF